MSESLFDLINQQNKEINPSPIPQQSRNQETYKTQQNNCNIAWCKFCHHNPKSYQQMKKFKYQKRWNTNLNAQNLQKPQMLYCIKKTQNLNKKIEEHNLKVKKERE